MTEVTGKACKREQGFTLVELVIVVVLLGILAGYASSKFGSLDSDAKAGVMKQLRGSLETALVSVRAAASTEEVGTRKLTAEDVQAANTSVTPNIPAGKYHNMKKYDNDGASSTNFAADDLLNGIKYGTATVAFIKGTDKSSRYPIVKGEAGVQALLGGSLIKDNKINFVEDTSTGSVRIEYNHNEKCSVTYAPGTAADDAAIDALELKEPSKLVSMDLSGC